MIIDSGNTTLTVRRARKLLGMISTWENVTEDTEISFHYHSGSGWTLDLGPYEGAYYGPTDP